MIPKQLQNDVFKFVLLKHKEKIPFEFNWTINNYNFNDPKLLKWIEEGGNYGVIGGYGGLLVLDFDDIEIQKKIVPLLPKTFTIKTGSGKLHKYFISDDPESFKVLNSKKETLIDIQGEGKQVVGANCFHPNGNKYEVIDDSEIARISNKRLKIVLNDYLKDKDKFKPNHVIDPIVNKIKEKVSLVDLMQEYNYDVSISPTMCKLGHGSKGEKCFSFNENSGLWHCFHCDAGGDIFNFVMEHDNCDFIKAKQKLMNRAGIKNNLAGAIKGLDQDYVEFAEKFFQIQPYFYDKAKMWWLWNFKDAKWESIDEVDMLNSIYESAKDSGISITNQKIKSNIITALKMIGRLNIPKKTKKTWVQFKNKIYDVLSGIIHESTPEFFNVNPIPWDVGDSQDTPVMDKIFTEWVGEEKKELLYDIIAYSILQDFPLHRIFCLVGNGCNGKSVFLNLLNKFIGDENCASTELDGLLERFGTSVLFKKLVCLIGETNSNKLEKTSLLKRISGNDSIDFEFKGKDRFKGKSYCTLLIATNTLPTTMDRTDGFYRRWVILSFPNKFTEKIDILSTIPDSEYNNLALKSLYNLKRILENRSFRREGSIEERKARYEEHSDPLKQFIETECYTNPNLEIPVFEFYDAFCVFLEKNRYREMSKKEVSQGMSEHGFESKQICKKVGDSFKNWRYFLGISIKP